MLRAGFPLMIIPGELRGQNGVLGIQTRSAVYYLVYSLRSLAFIIL